jgi:hypothetical protein
MTNIKLVLIDNKAPEITVIAELLSPTLLPVSEGARIRLTLVDQDGKDVQSEFYMEGYGDQWFDQDGPNGPITLQSIEIYVTETVESRLRRYNSNEGRT